MASEMTVGLFACMTQDEQKIWEALYGDRLPISTNKYIKYGLTCFEEKIIKKYEISSD